MALNGSGKTVKNGEETGVEEHFIQAWIKLRPEKDFLLKIKLKFKVLHCAMLIC